MFKVLYDFWVISSETYILNSLCMNNETFILIIFGLTFLFFRVFFTRELNWCITIFNFFGK